MSERNFNPADPVEPHTFVQRAPDRGTNFVRPAQEGQKPLGISGVDTHAGSRAVEVHLQGARASLMLAMDTPDVKPGDHLKAAAGGRGTLADPSTERELIGARATGHGTAGGKVPVEVVSL
jgi:hypothetical protein